MSTMFNKAQGYGLSLLTKLASYEALDQLKIRKLIEKSLYQSSKAGFSALHKSNQFFKPKIDLERQRLPAQNKNLFDLNLTEDQQMTVDMMSEFAQDILYPLAAEADHQQVFPPHLWQYAQELGLNFFALPEALSGVAAERNVVTNILIAEQLARGDFSLTATLLSTPSVINTITQWGSQDIQASYLHRFAEHPELIATFAVQENTPAFNPYQLKTTAQPCADGYVIEGEKTLVMMGAYADLYIVSAMLHDQPQIFIVERNEAISMRSSPAMGLKATETVSLVFKTCPARLLNDTDFNYSEFLDLGNLMWCAMAVGTCEAIKTYCIQYANDRTAFGEPISHRQSVAFMIADMAIEIDAMRMLILNAASLAESGKPFHREAYLARLLCAEKAMKIGTDGVQVLGGHGFTKEHPVERWYRDLRATSILHSGLHA